MANLKKDEKKILTVVQEIESMITHPLKDQFSEKKRNMKSAEIKHLSTTMAKHISANDRISIFVTLTFDGNCRANFKKTPIKKYNNMPLCNTTALWHLWTN